MAVGARAQAIGPVRGVRLTQGELLETGESGMFWRFPACSSGDEVALDDEQVDHDCTIFPCPCSQARRRLLVALAWLLEPARYRTTRHTRHDPGSAHR